MPKIAITGDLGSGKSTVCAVLRQRYGFEIYSTGALQRSIAERYNMTTLELNKYSETHPEIDDEIDNTLTRLGREKDNIIFDSRMAWHFVPDAFKVFLGVDIDIAAERIMSANRGGVESYSDKSSARQKLRERKQSENSRYQTQYGVDCANKDNYNLIIDTSFSSPESAAELLYSKLGSWLAGEQYSRIWLPARLLYPTIDLARISIERIDALSSSIRNEGFHEDSRINVIETDGSYFISDGHHRVIAAYRCGYNLLPVNLLCNPVPAHGFANIHTYKGFAQMCGFDYTRYPGCSSY